MIADVLEQVLHGLTLGSMYAMVAAGLALMLGVARLINCAHGTVLRLLPALNLTDGEVDEGFGILEQVLLAHKV